MRKLTAPHKQAPVLDMRALAFVWRDARAFFEHIDMRSPFVAHFVGATSPVNGRRKRLMRLIFPPPFKREVLSDSEAEGAAADSMRSQTH